MPEHTKLTEIHFMEEFIGYKDWMCFMDDDKAGFTMVCPSEYLKRFIATDLTFFTTGIRCEVKSVPLFKTTKIGFYSLADKALAKVIAYKLLQTDHV